MSTEEDEEKISSKVEKQRQSTQPQIKYNLYLNENTVKFISLK